MYLGIEGTLDKEKVSRLPSIDKSMGSMAEKIAPTAGKDNPINSSIVYPC